MQVTKTEQRAPVSVAPLLAMCATAHNGLEKLSIRLAELQRDGIQFGDSECAAMQSHLDAARVASSNCVDLINKMRVHPIEIPALLDEEEAAGSTTSSLMVRQTVEDDMFPPGEVVDTLTGLPGRPMAFKAIQSAISVGRPRFAAVFCIDRLRYMSARYSPAAGQLSIKNYAGYLRQKMPADTMLFRWSGGSVVGLFDLSGTVSDARAIADNVSSQKIKLNFESDQRSALLNLTSTPIVTGLTSTATAESVVEECDSFVRQHSQKQPD